MLKPTGSVYLDIPRGQSSPASHSHRRRSVSAAVLGFIGITAMIFAGLLAAVHHLVAEPGPTLDAISAALDSPIARAELHEEISEAVADGLIGAETSDAASVYGIDVAVESHLVADEILDDAAFRSALDDLVETVHRLAFVDSESSPVDFNPITEAALGVLTRESPALADLSAPGAQIITFEETSIPDLTAPMRFVDRALVAALVGMLGLPLALAVHPRRHRVMAWAGRTWLLSGIVVAGFAVGVPYLGKSLTGWSTVEIALRAGLQGLVVPSLALAIGGGFTMAIAGVFKRRYQMKTTEEGAVAALGLLQLPPPLPPMEPRRSTSPALIDAGRPLTNI